MNRPTQKDLDLDLPPAGRRPRSLAGRRQIKKIEFMEILQHQFRRYQITWPAGLLLVLVAEKPHSPIAALAERMRVNWWTVDSHLRRHDDLFARRTDSRPNTVTLTEAGADLVRKILITPGK